MERSSKPQVESVDRALHLVLALQAGRAVSVREAAAELSVADSTAHRLLSTLVGRGFAVQDRSRRYKAGPALVPLSAAPLSRRRLTELSRSVLRFLHDALRETVHVVVRDGVMVTFLDGLESSVGSLGVELSVGRQMPAHCTASGRALLAELPNETVEQTYRHGLVEWPAARITTLSALKRRLGAVRRDGYSSNFEETERGVTSFGVAVCHGAGPVCALAVALPSARYQRIDTPRYAAVLMEGARRLEGLLIETGDPAHKDRPRTLAPGTLR